MDLINGNVPKLNNTLVASNQAKAVSRVSWRTPGNGNIFTTSVNLWSSSTATNVERPSTPLSKDVQLSELKTGRYNTYWTKLILESNSKFSVQIDWGDGNIDNVESSFVNYYSLNDIVGSGNYNDFTRLPQRPGNTNVLFIGYFKNIPYVKFNYGADFQVKYLYVKSNTKEPLYPITHEYSDNKIYNVVITVTEGNPTTTELVGLAGGEYPIFELQALNKVHINATYFDKDFPLSMFTYLKALHYIDIQKFLVSTHPLQQLPDSLFNCTTLTTLRFELSAPSDNRDLWSYFNLDRITKLSKLITLEFKSVYKQTVYPKVLEKLTELRGLKILLQDIKELDVTNVDTFGSITGLYIFNRYCPKTQRDSDYYKTLAQCKADISKIQKGCFVHSEPLANGKYESIPDYFNRMYSLQLIFDHFSAGTQSRVDSIVDVVYDETIKHPMTPQEDGHRNLWYYLTSTLYGHSTGSPKRPTGTYQAPSGFEQGVSNGTPASQMEKVYVLTHNYSQTWNIYGGLSTISDFPIRLVRNEEGNYIAQFEGGQLLGKNLEEVQVFQSKQDLLDYLQENNIETINDIKEETL